jgi:type I restriction enzyme S subunit
MSAATAVRLAEIAESIEYGVTASASNDPVGPKFLRITDIQNGGVAWENVPWCVCNEREVASARLKLGDIVFARTGATTGKSFLVRDCPANAVFASYLIRVRLGEMADNRFVSHFFQTSDYWAQITKSARGVAQPGVNATTLKDLKIPLPPLPEQRRIADILDKADALRAKRRAAIKKLDELTQSIFLDMFGDPATNPKGWRVATLNSLGQVITGTTPPSARAAMFDGPVPFVTPGDLESGQPAKRTVTEEGAAASRTVNAGATLVCCIGATIGKMSNVPVRSAFNQQINAVQWGPNVDPQYGLVCMRFFKPKIIAWGASTTLPILKKSTFEQIEIPVPPYEHQRAFASLAEMVRQMALTHKSSLHEAETLFASLQHRAFRGDLWPESEKLPRDVCDFGR